MSGYPESPPIQPKNVAKLLILIVAIIAIGVYEGHHPDSWLNHFLRRRY